MRPTYAHLELLDIFEKGMVWNMWKHTLARWDRAIGLGYFQEDKAIIFGKGYAVLEGFADLVVLSASARS